MHGMEQGGWAEVIGKLSERAPNCHRDMYRHEIVRRETRTRRVSWDSIQPSLYISSLSINPLLPFSSSYPKAREQRHTALHVVLKAGRIVPGRLEG